MQAATVAACGALIGVHGAALSNTLFAPSGALVVQLVPSCFPRSYTSIGSFHWAAAALDVLPALWRCRCACKQPPPRHNDLLEDCATVRRDELAAMVAAHLDTERSPRDVRHARAVDEVRRELWHGEQHDCGDTRDDGGDRELGELTRLLRPLHLRLPPPHTP